MRPVAHVLILSSVVGALGGAHVAHRHVDEVRFDQHRRDTSSYQPNGDALKVASMGQSVLVADTMWVRAVLQFSDVMDAGGRDGAEWLDATLQAVATLDPVWRTVYFYGGAFMRVLGDIDASDRLFGAGMEALPDDPFFPFSIGMNAYLHRGDTEIAANMLQRAASLPNAPRWYAAAAASFIEKRGQRASAVRYIDEELARTTNEAARSSLELRRTSLIHEELVEKLRRKIDAWEAANQRRLVSLDALGELPPDPYGEVWVLGADHRPRSSVIEARLARQARIDERAMLLLDPSEANAE